MPKNPGFLYEAGTSERAKVVLELRLAEHIAIEIPGREPGQKIKARQIEARLPGDLKTARPPKVETERRGATLLSAKPYIRVIYIYMNYVQSFYYFYCVPCTCRLL